MSENNKWIEVKVPGSTANLGPGFDSFGLALPIYLRIRIKEDTRTTINLIGDNISSLPVDETNLIYKTIDYFFQLENKETPNLTIEIDSEIPLSRGLGSSGAAIVGGLLVANKLLGNPKSIDEIFQLAVKIEGHPDNVGASLYGGFIIATNDGENAVIESLPFPKELRITLAIPRYTLSTKIAREKIPSTIPLKDVSYNIGHASLLVAYLLTNQLDKIPQAMKDRVHQPYRKEAIKGLERLIEEANITGAFSVALSGAGPTIIIFSKEEQVPSILEMIHRISKEEQIEFEVITTSASEKGYMM